MAPELLAAIQIVLDISVDVKKGTKAGGIVSTLMADADLVAKVELLTSKLGSIPADVKTVSAADLMPLLGVLIPGVEAIIAA